MVQRREDLEKLRRTAQHGTPDELARELSKFKPAEETRMPTVTQTTMSAGAKLFISVVTISALLIGGMCARSYYKEKKEKEYAAYIMWASERSRREEESKRKEAEEKVQREDERRAKERERIRQEEEKRREKDASTSAYASLLRAYQSITKASNEKRTYGLEYARTQYAEAMRIYNSTTPKTIDENRTIEVLAREAEKQADNSEIESAINESHTQWSLQLDGFILATSVDGSYVNVIVDPNDGEVLKQIKIAKATGDVVASDFIDGNPNQFDPKKLGDLHFGDLIIKRDGTNARAVRGDVVVWEMNLPKEIIDISSMYMDPQLNFSAESVGYYTKAGYIFILSSTDTPRIRCIHLSDGRTLWEHYFNINKGFAKSMMLVKEEVFVVVLDQIVVLNLESGKEKFRFRPNYNYVVGADSSMIYLSTIHLLSTGSKLAAFRRP